MPAAEAERRLEGLEDGQVLPLQLVHSRYGLSLAFEDGKLVNPKLRALHRLGIISCRLVKTSTMKSPPSLGDHVRIIQRRFDGNLYVSLGLKGYADFDRVSTRRVKEIIGSSLIMSGTVIYDDSSYRVLATTGNMTKLRGEKSFLDDII